MSRGRGRCVVVDGMILCGVQGEVSQHDLAQIKSARAEARARMELEMAERRKHESSGGGEPMPMGEVTIQMMTARAILVITQKKREVWLPMKACHDTSEIYGVDVNGKHQKVGDKGKLVLCRWFTDKQGWSK